VAAKTHYSFKKELAYELALPLVERRSKVKSLRSPAVKDAMKAVGIEVDIIEMARRQVVAQGR
jgi:hypothetical protein